MTMGRYEYSIDNNSMNNNEVVDEGAEIVVNENETMSEEGLASVLESYLCSELVAMGEEKVQEFLHSQACQTLQEKGLIGKKTMVRLSKVDDLERRIGMAALQYAKEKNDPLYNKLLLNRIKEKELLDKINQRYQAPAVKIAKSQQKDFINGKHLPLTFNK